MLFTRGQHRSRLNQYRDIYLRQYLLTSENMATSYAASILKLMAIRRAYSLLFNIQTIRRLSQAVWLVLWPH